MCIHPVLFGVLATLFVEMVALITITIYSEVRAARKKKAKGGNNNG